MEAPQVQAAAARVKETERAIVEAKRRHTEALAASKRHHTAVRAAVTNYLAEFPIITPLENARRTIQANQAEKQAIADGRAPPRQYPPAPRSYIDRVAANSSGGNADDFTRSTMRTGYHRQGVPRGAAEQITARVVRARVQAEDAAAAAAAANLARKRVAP